MEFLNFDIWKNKEKKTVIENKENLEQTLLKKNNTNTIPEERKQNDDDEHVRVHHQENCHQQ